MNSKIILCVALCALLFFAGCSNEPDEKTLKRIKEIDVFLKEHKNAKISSVFFSAENFDTVLAFAPLGCKQMPKKAYWKVLIRSGEESLTVYLDADSMKAECISDSSAEALTNQIEPTPLQPAPCDEMHGFKCAAKEYCNEALLPATDTERCCPIKCESAGIETPAPPTPITEPTDTPEETPTPISSPTASPTPTPTATPTASPTPTMSPTSTPPIDSCEGITCPTELECSEGACVLQTCVDQGGKICGQDEYCSTQYLLSGDSLSCCSTSCTAIQTGNCDNYYRNVSLFVGTGFYYLAGAGSFLDMNLEIRPDSIEKEPFEVPVAEFWIYDSEGYLIDNTNCENISINTDLQECFNSAAQGTRFDNSVLVTGLWVSPNQKTNLLVKGCLADEICESGICVQQ